MIKNKPKIILSFDDGPHAVWTKKILDLLERYQVKALFFLVGKQVIKYPRIVKELIEQGHVIGNHTWSHRPLFTMSERKLKYEINDYDQYFKTKFNYKMQYFRPPWGLITARQCRIIKNQLGYKIIFWNKNAHDYIWPFSRNLYRTITKIQQNPCIFLFHDGIILSPVLTRKYMLATVEKFLQLKCDRIDFVLPE
jgi:peptidoglycan/xylan/chitin deacetylase (PgdA/CDA1 family)